MVKRVIKDKIGIEEGKFEEMMNLKPKQKPDNFDIQRFNPDEEAQVIFKNMLRSTYSE